MFLLPRSQQQIQDSVSIMHYRFSWKEYCFDTDSVTYEYDNNEAFKSYMGHNLDKRTNDLKDDEYITHFVSSGPKSYGYTINLGCKAVKLKGMTLNHENAQTLNFDTFVKLVLFWADPGNHLLKMVARISPK